MVCNQAMEGRLREHLFLSMLLHPRGTPPPSPSAGFSGLEKSQLGRALLFHLGLLKPQGSCQVGVCVCLGQPFFKGQKKRVYGWMKPQPGPQTLRKPSLPFRFPAPGLEEVCSSFCRQPNGCVQAALG